MRSTYHSTPPGNLPEPSTVLTHASRLEAALKFLKALNLVSPVGVSNELPHTTYRLPDRAPLGGS